MPYGVLVGETFAKLLNDKSTFFLFQNQMFRGSLFYNALSILRAYFSKDWSVNNK